MKAPDGSALSFDTARLRLRMFTPDDASFMLELQTDSSWLRHIGDRGVHDLDSARDYLHRVPLDMYRGLGFGPLRMDLRDGTPVGMCGLFKRDTLDDVDLGYALLPRHRGMGYAAEAAAATLAWACGALGLRRVIAITSPDNDASGRVLERAGMRFERMLSLAADPREVNNPQGWKKLYAVDFT
jgi:[ribosomal protein S5]-alanine N-acetyltransferase